MEFEIDNTKAVQNLIKVLEESGIYFRPIRPGEEGGFFYYENGERKKFTDNIFVKRSIKYENDHSVCSE